MSESTPDEGTRSDPDLPEVRPAGRPERPDAPAEGPDDPTYGTDEPTEVDDPGEPR